MVQRLHIKVTSSSAFCFASRTKISDTSDRSPIADLQKQQTQVVLSSNSFRVNSLFVLVSAIYSDPRILRTDTKGVVCKRVSQLIKRLSCSFKSFPLRASRESFEDGETNDSFGRGVFIELVGPVVEAERLREDAEDVTPEFGVVIDSARVFTDCSASWRAFSAR